MNICISNLGLEVNDEDLKKFFEGFGKVDSARIVFDRETRKSRGFGFVEMPDQKEALNAMRSIDGGTLEGSPVKLNMIRSLKRSSKYIKPYYFKRNSY